jgi:hypothetical protein
MTVFVHGDEVDRECRAEQMSAMAGNTVRRTVLCDPPAMEWQSQHNWRGVQRAITSGRKEVAQTARATRSV